MYPGLILLGTVGNLPRCTGETTWSLIAPISYI